MSVPRVSPAWTPGNSSLTARIDEGESGLDARKQFFDGSDRLDLARGDGEARARLMGKKGPHDFALVTRLLEVDVEAHAARNDIEELGEREELAPELGFQVRVSKAARGAPRRGHTVVVVDEGSVRSASYVELDVVDAEPDRAVVTLVGGQPGDAARPSVSADQRTHCATVVAAPAGMRRH